MAENDNGPMVPPPGVLARAHVGGGDFNAIGREFLHYFRELARVHADHQILEIGCGVGRMAIPLTELLSPPGSYEGFDIRPACIKWCEDEITRRYPHFNFRLIDVANSYYNPARGITASQLAFPYNDCSFDTVIAVSVFTQMLPAGTANYLKECHRVLRPNGCLFATWFLWFPGAEARSAAERRVPVSCGHYRIARREVPEGAVALDTDAVYKCYAEAGFSIRQKIDGTWTTDQSGSPYQDIVVATKAAAGRNSP
jgi:SAM-dependent methyltransferase